MNLREQIYADYIRELKEHYEENRAAAEAMKEELQHTQCH